ncbi:MAG: hypothetical protein ABIE94_04885 [archaeon]
MARLNKKAFSAKYMLLWIMRFIILAIVVFVIIMLFRMLIVNDMRVLELKREVLYSRIIYSPNALTYVDRETGRAYPGIIDLDKFTTTNMHSSMDYSYDQYISAKISLLDTNGDAVKSPIYFNKVWYDRWLPLSNWRFLGLGSTDRMDYKLPVTYEDKGEFKQAVLHIDIIQPESG